MSEEKSLFETIGIQYEEKDGLLYPIFTEEAPTESIHVGKYGDLWMEYLKDNHPDRYRHLFRFGKLMKKAVEVNEKIYGVPTYKDSSLSEYFVWDQDIADKYNIDVNSVTDFNTLYDALKTVKEGEGGSP